MLFRAKAPLEGGMNRIAITAEAFEAVSVLLPGNVGYEREPTEDGERLIWLEPHVQAALPARPRRILLRCHPEAVALEARDEL